jgi:two-component system, cell cycle sensor histidine kinase and response regulator CckA
MKYVHDVFLLKRNGWILAVILSLTLMLSLFWNWQQMEKQVHDLALNGLKLSFEKDVVYRRWAANHGGVYVPVSEHTQPNPYLNHIPERDIVTSTGVSMTLVNPAYMTRQVYELSKKQYGLQGHITSLNPLRPENIPDEWEKQSLKKFNEGAKEAIIVMEIDGLPYMRLMKPFFTEEGCLKCHGHQGYKTGDIHGGISVSTPILSYLEHIQSRQYSLLAGHGIIWIAGLFFIGYTTSRIVAARMAGEEERKQAEDALMRSEGKYRALVEQSVEMLFLHDLTGGMLDVNKAAVKKTGYSKEELLHLNVFDLHVNKSDRNEIIDQWKSWRAGQNITLEREHMGKDGTVYPVEITSGKIYIGDKDYILALVRDITERKKAETFIREANQRVLTILNNINAIVYVADMDSYDVLFLNRYGRTDHGEIIGKKCWSTLQVGQSGPCVFCTNQKLVDTEGNPTGIYRWEFKSPKTGKWYDCQDSAIKWIDGRIVRLEIAIDITERKLAEEALRHEYSFRNAIIDNVAQGLCVCHATDEYPFVKFTVWNDRMTEITGYTIDEINRLGWYQSLYPDPELQTKAQERMNKMRQGDDLFCEEWEISRVDGNKTILNISSSIIESDDGAMHVLALMQDITERKQAEKIIKASLKEKETLLKEVHHRVKNNMQVISSLLNFHVLKEKDEHVIKALRDCRGRINSMACVHEMLHMSESLSEINCHDYISKLAYDILQSYYPELHRVKITVDAKGVTLGIQQATPLGLIINEMLSNALKYGFPENSHGQIMIRLKMCEPNIIEFIFSDNGIGIPKDLDWRNTESLGLKLIVLLAENQLDGTVTLDRKQGTCFIINFSLENNQT